jgi:hypothetical protein
MEQLKLTENDSLDEVSVDDVSLKFIQQPTSTNKLCHQESNKGKSRLLPARKQSLNNAKLQSNPVQTLTSLESINENKAHQPQINNSNISGSSINNSQSTISNRLPSIPKRKVSLVNLNKYGNRDTALSDKEVFKRPTIIEDNDGDEVLATPFASLRNKIVSHASTKNSVLDFARPMDAKRAIKNKTAKARWTLLRRHLLPNQKNRMGMAEAVRLAQTYEKAKKGIAAKEANTKKQSDNLVDKTNKRKLGVVLLACMVEADLPNDFYEIVSRSRQLDKILKSFAGVSADSKELLTSLCRESVDQMAFQGVLSEMSKCNNTNNNSNIDNTWSSTDSVFTHH